MRRGLILGAVLLMLGLALELAGPLGVGRLPVIAALVAPRDAVTAALGVLGVAFLLVGTATRRRRITVPAGAALLIAALVGLPIAASRGTAQEAAGAPRAGTVRILSWNINGDLVQPSVVARLAVREHADLVVLPQIAPAENGPDWIPAFAAAGLPAYAVPAIGRSALETVVLVSERLPRYRGAATWPEAPDSSAIARATDRSAPTILALHAAQPTLTGNALWRSELDRVAAACMDPEVVVVGDFNGTLDDFGGPGVGGCRDGAALRGAAALGTWPTALPPLLAMPIDHVLVGSHWRVRSFSVLTSEDGSGARHRPILAVLARR